MRSWRWSRQEPPPRPEHQAIAVTRLPAPHEAILELARQWGGGLFVGSAPDDGSWDDAGGAPLVFTRPRRCLLVCAPSQTGKTSALAIPQLLAAPGPAVCTSTKLDIFDATALVRATHGRVWVYDPGGTETLPPGARALRWSPIVSSGTWDQALATARAMVKVAGSGQGLKDEVFWTEQAIVILAVVLYRAALVGADMRQVLIWLAEKNAEAAAYGLADAEGEELAVIAARGIADTPGKEQSGYWSTAAVTVRAYWSRPALAATTDPNFDAAAFVAPHGPHRFDTVYVTSGTDDQEQYAPLIVGMIESIRKAAYEAARRQPGGALNPPLYLILDEAANIAPLPSLPSLCSEAPGRGVYTAVYFQSLTQALPRWGEQAKDFMTLFTERALLPGIMDRETLERFSMIVGEYDRQVPGGSIADAGPWGQKQLSESWSIQRQPILPPAEVSAGPGFGYFWYHSPEVALSDGRIAALALTPWYVGPPWPQVIISAMSAYRGASLPRPELPRAAFTSALFPGAAGWESVYRGAYDRLGRAAVEQREGLRLPLGEHVKRRGIGDLELPPGFGVGRSQ